MKRTATVLAVLITSMWQPVGAEENSLSRRVAGSTTEPSAIIGPLSLSEYQALLVRSYKGVGDVLEEITAGEEGLSRLTRETRLSMEALQAYSAEIGGSGRNSLFEAQETWSADRSFVSVDKPSVLQDRAFCGNTLVNLCLLGRFRVLAAWSNPYIGPQVYPAGAYQLTYESGYMWWTSSSNMEVPIKVLNFCSSEGRYKYFVAGLTNFEILIRIIDDATGTYVDIINPAFEIFDTRIGSLPFPCL